MAFKNDNLDHLQKALDYICTVCMHVITNRLVWNNIINRGIPREKFQKCAKKTV